MSHCNESFSTVPCHHGLRLLPPATPFTGPPFLEEVPPSLPDYSPEAHSAHLACPPHPHGAEIPPPEITRAALAQPSRSPRAVLPPGLAAATI